MSDLKGDLVFLLVSDRKSESEINELFNLLCSLSIKMNSDPEGRAMLAEKMLAVFEALIFIPTLAAAKVIPSRAR